MSDSIRFKRGPKSNLSMLGLGEPGLTTDADDQRLYIGGPSGNIPIPNMTDIDAINSELSKHKYKSFYGFASIGVDDSTLSATDFAANIVSIYNTMYTNSCCSLTVFVQNSNFATSLSSKLLTDLGVSISGGTGFLIEIVCNAGINTPNKMFVYPNNSNRIFYISIDGSAMTTKELTTDDSGWLDLPLSSGISSLSGHTCQYRKIGNVVYIKGLITGFTSTGSSVVIATLPAGYRPFAAGFYICPKTTDDTNIANIGITTSGTLILKGTSVAVAASQAYSLSGISFTVN